MRESDFDRLFPARDKDLYLAWHKADEDFPGANYRRILEEGIEIIHSGHKDYPHQLLQRYLQDAPALFFAKGKLALFNSPSVAIIGSRKASPFGKEWSEKVASWVAQIGWNVVSGYAWGVDLYAHFGALQAGGTTTLVLSYGIDNFIPQPLLQDYNWSTKALIVSQFPPQAKWQNPFGVIRNRTIVGLSSAVIVIEASAKGGTMFTATYAMEKRIPVFVLDPRPFDFAPEGNKLLPSMGAKVFDTLEELTKLLPSVN
jgi:DNA processing protein